MTDTMEELRVEFKRLEHKVSDIKGTLDEVHGAIIGNPLTKDGGISKRLTMAEKQLEDIETRLDTAEKKQMKYNLYVIIMWTCVGGAASFMFAYILQLIFKHS